MANEEETYAVKSGNYWHVRRVRDNMTVGYITDRTVVSVMRNLATDLNVSAILVGLVELATEDAKIRISSRMPSSFRK